MRKRFGYILLASLLLLPFENALQGQIRERSTTVNPSLERPVETAAATTAQTSSFFDGREGSFSPKWSGTVEVTSKADLNKMVKTPWFDGCALDPDVVNLPYKEILVPLGSNEEIEVAFAEAVDANEEMSADFRQSLSQSGLSITSQWYPAQNVVPGARVMRQNRPYQYLKVYPIQVSSDGSRIRKATTINYRINKVKNSQKRLGSGSQKTYASNSLLASGNWKKIAVFSEGIYKIDYNTLNAMGINPVTVDPRTIKVYGDNGGMLSQIAGESQNDDMVENSIFVSGQADGKFDQGDYILFYGASPHEWKYSTAYDRYYHRFNLYSDTTFYFITSGGNTGKRISSVASVSGATQTPSSTTKTTFYEKDLFNALQSGRAWLGESFDLNTDQTFSFNLPNLAPNTNLLVTTRVAARSNTPSAFSIREGNTNLGTINVINTNSNIYGSYYYRADWETFTLPSSSITDGSLDLSYSYNKPLSASVGYLDFIEVQYKQNLTTGGFDAWKFTATDNVGPGEVFEYNIAGGSNSFMIWDITDPVNARSQSFNMNGSNMNFAVNADSIKTFYAFNVNGAKTPTIYSNVPNQDLHGLSQVDYLIVTDKNFLSAAQKLATFHRETNNLSVHVVTVPQIYNEFSHGRQDPCAIRDFTKMFYDRGISNNSNPKYLLLFGDGSYDPKRRVSQDHVNFIPTYQSRKSMRPTESYTSDDFYGFLDDAEGYWGEKAALEGGTEDILFAVEGDSSINTHNLDLGIGRIPVATASEANYMVDKIIRYANDPSGLGDWRSKLVLAADHKDTDGIIHISQADSYTSRIEASNPCINLDKIYMDNYIMENTASGSRFPSGKYALIKSLNEGSLIVNYTGHGGEIGWSNSSILEVTDILNLQNGNRLPAYVTATCEFGRWDDPGRRSGAEVTFLREEGGSIAMFTTVRVVYSGPNYILNTNFYKYALQWDSTLNRMPTMGEIFMKTKNDSWLGGINNRNFTLMGDPALTLAYPKLNTVITNINGVAVQDTVVDSLGALSLVTVQGEVRDPAGNLQSGFTGDLFVTVFDKPSRFTTKRSPFNFLWQKNKVFNGKASVQNGVFSFQFVVPVDVSYEDGNGKISLYAENGSTDAGGCRTQIYIGGSGDSTIADNKGPELELYMNDEKFAEGGMVGPDPLMIASIFDENGINTVGSGVGHELTAVLNGNESNVIVLNDFYEASKNSYQEGEIRYPFQELPAGEHLLRVKVWDVANNSSEAEITFLVADDASMALGHVLNYPNPFTTNTKFFIEHNRNGQLLDVQVKIYTVSGRMVKSLESSFFADGNLYCDLEWDGLDEFGDVLGRGVYVYQVSVQDQSTGERVSRFEKMVVLR